MIISRRTKWERVRTQLLSKARARMTQGFQELILACPHVFTMFNATLLKPNALASVSICFFGIAFLTRAWTLRAAIPKMTIFGRSCLDTIFGPDSGPNRARFGPGFGFGGDFRVWSKRSPPDSGSTMAQEQSGQGPENDSGGHPA